MKERCGVLANNNFFEIKNISDRSDIEFIMDPIEFYEIVSKYEIKAIVHTHLHDSCELSYRDLINMKIWKIPWIIIAKDCAYCYIYSKFGILKFDIKTSFFKKFYNLLMKLLE